MHRPLALFAPAFALVYGALYALKLPVLVYYPLQRELAFERLSEAHGPGMLWYGWLAAGLLAGLVAVMLVPARWAARVPASTAWLPAFAVMGLVVLEESRWFLP